MKESTTKEKVLKKVRNALMQNLPSSTSNIDFDKSIFEVSNEPLDIQFVKSFKENGGRFIFCENFTSVQENIALIINQLQVNELVCIGENIPQLTNAIQLIDDEEQSGD